MKIYIYSLKRKKDAMGRMDRSLGHGDSPSKAVMLNRQELTFKPNYTVTINKELAGLRRNARRRNPLIADVRP